MNTSPEVQRFTGLRAALADPGRRLLGTFVVIPSVEVVEIIGAAGFDVVVIDAEHGPFAIGDLTRLVAAAQGAGLFAVVRVAQLDRQAIGALLDIGADGVLVPHVASGAAAGAAVAAARYPSEGIRSLHGGVRGARYGADPNYIDSANKRCAVLVMCEDVEAVEALEDLVATPGLDSLFVGPYDLSAAMGYPGQPALPVVEETVARVLARAQEAGIAASLMAVSPQAARRWFDGGARLVLVTVDTSVLLAGYRSLAEIVRGR